MTKRNVNNVEQINTTKKPKLDNKENEECFEEIVNTEDKGIITSAEDFNNFIDTLSQTQDNLNEQRLQNSEVSKPKKILYEHNDQGPFIVFIENLITNKEARTINDIRIGKLMKAKNLTKDIIELRQTGRQRIKISFSNKISANSLVNDINLVTENLKAFIPSQFIQRIGIVKNIETDISNEELIENSQCPEKISIKETNRFFKTIRTMGKDDKKIPLTTVKIIFSGQQLPEYVYIYNVKRKVQPYIFSVTQCFKCLRYGHTKKNCKSKTSNCQNCGEVHDLSNGKCEKMKRCVNCKEQHISVNNECTEFIRQKAIKNIMSLQNLTFGEANEKYPKIQNRFSLLESIDDFPSLPGSQQKDQQTKIQIAKTERMYQIYTERKQQRPNNNMQHRFSPPVEEMMEIPSSPISNNPHRSSESDRLLENLTQTYSSVLNDLIGDGHDENGKNKFCERIQEMFKKLINPNKDSEQNKTTC